MCWLLQWIPMTLFPGWNESKAIIKTSSSRSRSPDKFSCAGGCLEKSLLETSGVFWRLAQTDDYMSPHKNEFLLAQGAWIPETILETWTKPVKNLQRHTRTPWAQGWGPGANRPCARVLIFIRFSQYFQYIFAGMQAPLTSNVFLVGAPGAPILQVSEEPKLIVSCSDVPQHCSNCSMFVFCVKCSGDLKRWSVSIRTFVRSFR